MPRCSHSVAVSDVPLSRDVSCNFQEIQTEAHAMSTNDVAFFVFKVSKTAIRPMCCLFNAFLTSSRCAKYLLRFRWGVRSIVISMFVCLSVVCMSICLLINPSVRLQISKSTVQISANFYRVTRGRGSVLL